MVRGGSKKKIHKRFRKPERKRSKKPWLDLLPETDPRRRAEEEKKLRKKQKMETGYFSFEEQENRLRRVTFDIEKNVRMAMERWGYGIRQDVKRELRRLGLEDSHEAMKKKLDDEITKRLASFHKIKDPKLIKKLREFVEVCHKM